MATTSIWRIKGWLGNVVVYVENPEKTANPAYEGSLCTDEAKRQSMEDVIAYAVQQEKTANPKAHLHDEDAEVMERFVSGVNCFPGTARDEMLAVKRRFGKEDGTVAYHGYQSFAPGEVTPEIAHEIGLKLAQKLWGEKYQVLVTTHLDKVHHIHNHFLVNTVSFVDGIKYHRTEKDYYEMRRASDELCREYGLSVILRPKKGRSKQYGEWRAEQEGRPTWRGCIRSDVDMAIRQSMTERQFFDCLRKKGYEIKVGKDISLRPPGKERFVRLERNFGTDYSQEGIRKRILGQQRRERPPAQLPCQKRQCRGRLQGGRKVNGLQALYIYYCYRLGIFPWNKSKQDTKRLHFLLREELLQMDRIAQETRLLARCHIDTAEQLFSYRSEVQQQVAHITTDRKELYRQQRTAAVKADETKKAAVKEQISALNKQLSGLRKEVTLCDDIIERSVRMKETLKTVQEDEQTNRKEETYHEHIRRCGRTNA